MTDRPRALILVVGDPASDPRIGWIADSLSPQFDVTEVGIHRDESAMRPPLMEVLSPSQRRVRAPMGSWPAFIQEPGGPFYAGNVGWTTLAGFAYEIAEQDAGDVHKGKLHADRALSERRAAMRRILCASRSLLSAATALGPAEVIIAADLDALPAGILLKQIFGAKLIYDAHEFWPYQFPNFESAAEEEAWLRIERRLIRETDARFVVSPQLAEAMREAYGLSVGSLPNAMPLNGASRRPAGRTTSEVRKEFLFLGNFAPGRGIQPLIRAWPHTPKNCVLVLQGPDSDYKTQMIAEAKQLGPESARIEFPPPISEDQLVERASKADVGVIPYEPTLLNHLFCSPNKLSQYMAAGLPILANTTAFVAQILKRADCGVVVDLENAGAVSNAVTRLCDDELRQRLGANARRGFEAFFNWEEFAPALLKEVKDAAYNGMPSPADGRAALNAAFLGALEAGDLELSPTARLARKARRFALQALWHGVPFLRVIVLSSPRVRRQAEKLRK